MTYCGLLFIPSSDFINLLYRYNDIPHHNNMENTLILYCGVIKSIFLKKLLYSSGIPELSEIVRFVIILKSEEKMNYAISTLVTAIDIENTSKTFLMCII